MIARKVLQSLSESAKGIFFKAEEIHQNNRLNPDVINEAVFSLRKSLLVEISDASQLLDPYDFCAVQITDFARQVLQKFC